MNLILFGFKGAGKTHFGKLLAAKLSRPFIDTDNLLAPNVKQLYIELGEQEFRAREKQAILSLRPTTPTIISLGGGAILDSETAHFLQQLGALIYLKASLATLTSRLKELPAFMATLNSLPHLLAQRIPIYESIPAHSIDTDVLTESEILNQLASYGV